MEQSEDRPLNLDSNTLNQIAFSLAEQYECVYYVDIATGSYIVFNDKIPQPDGKSEFPTEGEDFFADVLKNASLLTHPDDMEFMTKFYDRKVLIDKIANGVHYSVSFRVVIAGEVIHMRHVVTMCRDQKHIICCLENVEAEYREKEEQLRKLANAKLLARTDELTGVKNSTAFKEYVDQFDARIDSKEDSLEFAVVMCDINDLKHTNDTMGHNSGNEEIKETSRLICGIFQHSPVFRVGGDEFVVLLTGSDYARRDQLMNNFKDLAEANRRSGSGPVVAAGLAVFGEGDAKFSDVFKRADRLMYDNKRATKGA